MKEQEMRVTKSRIEARREPRPPLGRTPRASFRRMVLKSGPAPVDPATGKIPEGIAAQTGVGLLENLSAILAEQGMGLENVVKLRCSGGYGRFCQHERGVCAKHFKAPLTSAAALSRWQAAPGGPSEIEM